MCFRELPIEFDGHGRARLRDDAPPAPFEIPEQERVRRLEEVVRSAHVRDFDIDPVTRVAGALSFHTSVDLTAGRVLEARSEATTFRGYEVILRGRDPREAIHISSRACGVCGGVHSTCAAMALEMAYGVVPPPLALVTRNLGAAAELLYDHTLHLFVLAGPDYSETVVRRTNPSLWSAALKAAAPRSERHGFATVADLMRGLNPLTGDLYAEALGITRAAREVVSLMLGKYPHPSAIFPGGIGIAPTPDTFNQVLGRIVRLLDYAKKTAAVWDDLVEFFYAADPRYHDMGAAAANLLCTGMWDDPETYDATYARCSEWGERRLATPGAIVEGELRTTRLAELNLGIEEFVDHSYYEEWDGPRIESDPVGAPLSPYHPWNKETRPLPRGRSWKERYSWSTAPRWDRVPMESGPLARHWATALAGRIDNPFIRPTGDGIDIELPPGAVEAETLAWRLPERPNALERNRARAYHVGYTGMVAYTFLLKAFEMIGQGRTEMAEPFTLADEAVGVGFWEAGRGTLLHYVQIQGGRIANYQIVTPSTWMASPADARGVPGPYEQAVLDTPLLEESPPSDFTGVDILRTIRSFDPCLPCTVHVHAGERAFSRDATSCACGA